MIILGLLAFAFLIYFGAFVQWVFGCSTNTALRVSWHTTWIGIAALLIRLGWH